MDMNNDDESPVSGVTTRPFTLNLVRNKLDYSENHHNNDHSYFFLDIHIMIIVTWIAGNDIL